MPTESKTLARAKELLAKKPGPLMSPDLCAALRDCQVLAAALIACREPVEVSEGEGATSWGCPACKDTMFSTYKHCPNCGRELKWKS